MTPILSSIHTHPEKSAFSKLYAIMSFLRFTFLLQPSSERQLGNMMADQA